MDPGRPRWEACGQSPEPLYLSTIDSLSSTVGLYCEDDSTTGLVAGFDGSRSLRAFADGYVILCEIISVQEEQDRQCMYTVLLRRLRVSIVTVEKQ